MTQGEALFVAFVVVANLAFIIILATVGERTEAWLRRYGRGAVDKPAPAAKGENIGSRGDPAETARAAQPHHG